MKKITQEWLNKAYKDLLVAKREIKSENTVYDAVCFHSQQAVEKYLKALLQENEVYFEKTHDLDLLLEKCKDFVPEIIQLKEKIIELSSYAVEVRYPGVEATKEEAEDSLATAVQVEKIVKKYFKMEGL
ncbi:MAG: HEPN domain-containing protein [Exilispira sp.]|jgi:HEPN domain-containing protein|nr:HEPN domain-containing protein [Exilispira sp.]